MDVFVYGTLTEPARVHELLDSFAFVGGATLTGLRVVEGSYPTLAPPVSATSQGDRDRDGDGTLDSDGAGDADDADEPGVAAAGTTTSVDAAVGGRLLRTEEMTTLDEYERVDDGLYTRVSVPLVAPDGEREGDAAVYVGDPERLGADAAWPGTGSFPERVQRRVADWGITVRRRPER